MLYHILKNIAHDPDNIMKDTVHDLAHLDDVQIRGLFERDAIKPLVGTPIEQVERFGRYALALTAAGILTDEEFRQTDNDTLRRVHRWNDDEIEALKRGPSVADPVGRNKKHEASLDASEED